MLTYTSTRWVNGSGSPLNATNLNNIETGIDALVGAVNTHEGTLESHGTEIGNLKTVDATNATNIASNKENITKLTNDLATTNTTVADHESRVDSLESIVGPANATSGLTKRVKALEDNSATKVALNSATDRIGVIEATYATDNDLLAVDTRLTSDIDEVDERLKARIADAEQDIITLQNSSGGGGASTWEELSGKPNAFNPTSHANGDSSVYGAATTSLYGHVKISNGDVANTASAAGLAAGMDHSHSDYATKTEATTTTSGLLSASDKTKLDGIATGADKTTIVNNLTSDSVTAALSAAQGKALKTAIDSLTGDLGELGGGDMLKATYDTNNNGYVDNADNATKFDGHSVSEFSLDGHKHEIASVTGLQTALNGKSDSEHTHDYASKAFKSVVVGGATITADNHEDSIELFAGDNITLTGDATNDKVTIAAKDTTYTFTNKSATLAWGTTSTIATVGGTNITVKMPANPDTNTTYSAGTGISLSGTTFSNSGVRSITQDGTDGHKLTINTGGTTATITIPDNNTDTKVTAVGNHYTPSADSSSALSADASSSTSATWGTTALVTGVNIQRDAKGHVTGVTVDSIRMPSNPDTDTKYTLSSFGITATAAELNKLDGVTATTAELNYVDGVTSNIQTQLNALADLLTWKSF